MSTSEIEPNYETKIENFITLGLAGAGKIEAGPDQLEYLDELTERLSSGEFHVAVKQRPDSLPVTCIDGRSPANSANYDPEPNSAGGSESLLVADDLTNKKFTPGETSTAEGYATLLKFLNDNNLPIGGHSDTHAEGEASGCGANDKLETIYSFLAQNGDAVRQITQDLGIFPSNETHELIMKNANVRTSFSSGAELFGILEEQPYAATPELTGGHKEVIAVVNFRVGTTLDRSRLASEFGDTVQAFNIDAWSFGPAAEKITESAAEAERVRVAMTYYNVATAGVLCGPGMRVITLN